MAPQPEIRAWRPSVDGIAEVFHAYFPDHAYPTHTHDTWTLLIVDDGVVHYDLDRHEHGALRSLVTLLPPHVSHDGRSATARGFRKRVIYLDDSQVGADLIGAAVDRPSVPDPVLRDRIARLNDALVAPGDEFEAAGRLALIVDRLRGQLGARPDPVAGRDRGVAVRLRELLDANVVGGLTLDAAARTLQAHPTYLVRAFSREFGVPPHQDLTGRRLDRARRLLLAGTGVADVAAECGFYDQSHLNRHFKKMLGIAPTAYARSVR
ncbi:MAG TPA: AraC family transcriptional regulator [Micromonosporaceae bacterium]